MHILFKPCDMPIMTGIIPPLMGIWHTAYVNSI